MTSLGSQFGERGNSSSERHSEIVRHGGFSGTMLESQRQTSGWRRAAFVLGLAA